MGNIWILSRAGILYRSSRPRALCPLFSILAFLISRLHFCSNPSGGGGTGGGGGGGNAGTILTGEDAVMGTLPMPRKEGIGSPTDVQPFITQDKIQCSPSSDSSSSRLTIANHQQGRNVSDKTEEMKKKAFLALIHTLLDKVSAFFIAVSGTLFYYLLQQPQGIKDIWIAVLVIGCVIATISSVILAGLFSGMKESNSMDDFGFGIMKWLLLAVLVFFDAVLLTLLRAFASNLVLCIVGPIILISTVILWIWFILKKWPMVLKEMNTARVAQNGGV